MRLWKISTLVLAMLLVVVVGRSAMVRSASADKQPLMKKALISLEAAADALKNATHDKGGHRVKALELTNSAIDEVKKGIAYDDKH